MITLERNSGRMVWWMCNARPESMNVLNCFWIMVDWQKVFKPYFQPGPLSEIHTIANLQHVAYRVLTYAEPEFRLNWKVVPKTTTPQHPRIRFLHGNFGLETRTEWKEWGNLYRIEGWLQWFGHLEKYKRVLKVNAESSRLVVVFPMVNLGKNEMG